jgi:flagellar basal body rod protein FlgB
VKVDFESQLQSLMQGGDRKALEGFAPQMTTDAVAPVRADGSTVDVEREAAEQASNGLTYQALATVMRARIDIIESAVGAR